MAVLGLALIVVLWLGLYQVLMGQAWKDQDQAIRRAFRETELARVDKVDFYADEQAYQIIFGRDREGESMIVWVSSDEVHAEYAADGVSRRQVTDELHEREPRARIEKITPGKRDGEYVWEVFYQLSEPDGIRDYYDYYLFADGTWMDTYRLRLR